MRIIAAVFLAVCLFFAAPTSWIYYGLMGVSLYFTIVGNRWLLAGLTILIFAMLIGFAYAAQSIEFFLNVYNLIISGGFNANWLTAQPQYLYYVLPTLIAIMVGALAFVGTIYRGWADFWLASTFTSFLTYVFFAMLLLNCFFVGLTLYTFLSTTPWAIFAWELIFQWVPFFAALFIIYYFLGYIFDRPQKQHLTSREAHRRYLARQKRKA
jgi:hypothetical protein